MHTLLAQFAEGQVRALSRLISQVENQEPGFQQILAELYASAGRAVRIGITGPPGSGKSTLVNALAHLFLDTGKKVGVIAVDPSSPFTGGALLGDRVRMNEFPTDGSFFFRSMATRGASGGLAASTDNVTVVYDAFGFDVTIIETVGVGQVELDIIDSCDTVVVVVVPESGDSVQTMKAGLMEIADIFCVNKADRPGAERIGAELQIAMDTRKKLVGGWVVPVVPTEATSRKNVDRLFEKIHEHIGWMRETGEFHKQRRSQVTRKILHELKMRFERDYLDRLMAQMEFDRLIDDILAGRANPYTVGDALYRQFASV